MSITIILILSLIYGGSLLMLYMIKINGISLLNPSMFVAFTIVYLICCYVLRLFNIIGATKGISIAEKDKKVYSEAQKKVKTTQTILNGFENWAKKVGLPVSDVEIFEWNFIIMRVFKPIQCLNRPLKAIELIGMFRAASFLIIFVSAFCFVYTFSMVCVIAVVIALVLPRVVKAILTGVIAEQDRELERDFPDLYLLLYCNLMKGVNSRIAPALADYMRSCNALYAPNEHLVIRQFVQDLQNNIEVYADEATALVHMREKYRSALVVNFCNTATQALRGVPMADKLLNFKIELQAKQKDMMEKEAKARVELGRKSILLVYVILFEFVLLSWASKLF